MENWAHCGLATVIVATILATDIGTCQGESPTLPVPESFLQGSKWGPNQFGTAATVTWSYETIGVGQTDLPDFMPVGFEAEIESAFQTWSSVADINFQQVPAGGDISLYGQPIDGPGGISGTATFPNASINRIRFDTDNTWSVDGSGGTDVRRLAVHEIGHAIGLLHPPGVLARMNHSVSSAYDGLLPTDVAGVQAIYGPTAGFDVTSYLPTNVVSFDALPTSELTVTARLFSLEVSESTHFSGSLQSQVQWGAGSQPASIAFHAADLDFGSLTAELEIIGLNATLDFHDVQGDLFSKDWFGPAGELTLINDGSFDATNLVLGLVDGDVDYSVVSDVLGINITDNLNFNFVNTTGAGPQALGATNLGQQGSISRIGSSLALELPLNMQTTLNIPFNNSTLPVEFEITGTLHALAIVPEPSGLTVGWMAMLTLGVASRGRLTRRRS